jgi:hypothetical protein
MKATPSAIAAHAQFVPLILLSACALVLAVPAGARDASVGFDHYELVVGGTPGIVACGEIGVTNDGDVALDDVCFDYPGGGVIPLGGIEFIPPCMSLDPGETQTLTICLGIPSGIPAGVYTTTVWLTAAGGTLFDQLTIIVEVYCTPELNINDNAYHVIGNVMEITLPVGGGAWTGLFEIENTGSCALTEIEGPPPTGPPLIVVPNIPPVCGWNDVVVGSVEVTLVEPGLPAGTHEMLFEVTAEDGAYDFFYLWVTVPTASSSESWSVIKAMYH